MVLPSPKPDICLIVLDCLRADHLSLYGYPKKVTPHLDQWAKRAILYLNAFSTSNWTVPSHASIFTGLDPYELGVHKRNLCLDGRFTTLADILGKEGYRTIAITQNPLIGPSTNLTQGFEQTILIRNSKWQMRSREGFLRAIQEASLSEAGGKPGRPFFLFLNLMNLHSPHVPPARLFGRFYHPLLNPHNLLSLLIFFWKRLTVRKKFRAIHPSLILKWLFNNLYDLELGYLDDQLGRLFDLFERTARMENTLMIITSDHGENLGERGVTDHGCTLYDREIKIPLLLRFDGKFLEPGRVKKIVSLKQIFYTVIGLVGHGETTDRLGRTSEQSLFHLNEGEEKFLLLESEALLKPVTSFGREKGKNEARHLRNLGMGKRCVRTDHFKYILYEDGYEELFDVEMDPEEQKNLAGLKQEECLWLRSKLRVEERERERAGTMENEPASEEIQRQLKALGYLDSL